MSARARAGFCLDALPSLSTRLAPPPTLRPTSGITQEAPEALLLQLWPAPLLKAVPITSKSLAAPESRGLLYFSLEPQGSAACLAYSRSQVFVPNAKACWGNAGASGWDVSPPCAAVWARGHGQFLQVITLQVVSLMLPWTWSFGRVCAGGQAEPSWTIICCV